MKKYIGVFAMTVVLMSGLQGKVLTNSKVVFIDKLIAIKPKSYCEIIRAAKIAKELYQAVASAQIINAADTKALAKLVDVGSEGNNTTSDFCKALSVGSKNVVKSKSVNAKDAVELDKEVEQKLLKLLLDHMLNGFRRFFDDIYSDKCRKFLKPSFEESLKGHLGEEGVQTSFLFLSLDKDDTEVEDYYRDTINSVEMLQDTLKDLLVFLRDLSESLPRGKAAYMDLVQRSRQK
jgi:hypothetical protein